MLIILRGWVIVKVAMIVRLKGPYRDVKVESKM